MKSSGKFHFIIILFIILTFFSGCFTNREDDPQIRNAIAIEMEKFMSTYNKGDAIGLSKMYSKNGQILPPNRDVITGRDSIKNFWEKEIFNRTKTMKVAIVDIEVMGDKAFEIGRFILYSSKNKIIDRGKYITIWKKISGKWKIHRDIWNSN